jgi:hypothetical protein
VNQIPLREEQPAMLVNWVELTILNGDDGSVIYHNSFITNHFINLDNVAEVIASARVR